jgi:hypothetical protein
MKYVLGLIGLVAGLVFGNDIPDFDQKTELLLHRSIVTHGPLIPFVLFVIASGIRAVPLRWFALGLALSFAIHLSFDLFPKGWSGFALISIPTYGWTAQWFSWTWIASRIFACTYMALKLVRSVLDGGVFVLSLDGGFAYISMGEDSLWRPASALIIATAIAIPLAVRGAVSDD